MYTLPLQPHNPLDLIDMVLVVNVSLSEVGPSSAFKTYQDSFKEY